MREATHVPLIALYASFLPTEARRKAFAAHLEEVHASSLRAACLEQAFLFMDSEDVGVVVAEVRREGGREGGRAVNGRTSKRSMSSAAASLHVFPPSLPPSLQVLDHYRHEDDSSLSALLSSLASSLPSSSTRAGRVAAQRKLLALPQEVMEGKELQKIGDVETFRVKVGREGERGGGWVARLLTRLILVLLFALTRPPFLPPSFRPSSGFKTPASAGKPSSTSPPSFVAPSAPLPALLLTRYVLPPSLPPSFPSPFASILFPRPFRPPSLPPSLPPYPPLKFIPTDICSHRSSHAFSSLPPFLSPSLPPSLPPSLSANKASSFPILF